jgi:hypothetical protein
MKNLDQTHDFAESKFKKRERQLLDGQKAMAEQEAAKRAVNANTARLRALRLARDAAAVTPPAKPTPFLRTKKRAAVDATLAESAAKS